MGDEALALTERLPAPLDERAWEALLLAHLGAAVEVRYGRARREVIQLRRERGRLRLRLGPIMADAPDAVQRALAEWIRARGGRGDAQRVLDRWIDARLRASTPQERPAPALDAGGEHHDLLPLADELRRTEFADDFAARPLPQLGWGRAGKSRSRRSLRLGSFDPFSYTARVHPVLDSRDTPRFFVRYILFHELLHAALDAPPDADGRRRTHGPHFRARERAYVDFERALAWEKEHIRALIACARAGVGFTPAERVRAKRAPKSDAASRGWLQRLLF